MDFRVPNTISNVKPNGAYIDEGLLNFIVSISKHTSKPKPLRALSLSMLMSPKPQLQLIIMTMSL